MSRPQAAPSLSIQPHNCYPWRATVSEVECEKGKVIWAVIRKLSFCKGKWKQRQTETKTRACVCVSEGRERWGRGAKQRQPGELSRRVQRLPHGEVALPVQCEGGPASSGVVIPVGRPTVIPHWEEFSGRAICPQKGPPHWIHGLVFRRTGSRPQGCVSTESPGCRGPMLQCLSERRARLGACIFYRSPPHAGGPQPHPKKQGVTSRPLSESHLDGLDDSRSPPSPKHFSSA